MPKPERHRARRQALQMLYQREVTGDPIAPERLEALPWAAYCIDCQATVDKTRR